MGKECKRCDGTGSVECPKCDGNGYVERYTRVPILSDIIDSFDDDSTRPCEKCDETGKIRCPNCDGSGSID